MNPSTSNSNDYLQYLNDRLYFQQRQLNHSALFYCTNQSQNQQDDDYNYLETPIFQTILPINIITPISLDRFNYLEYLNNNKKKKNNSCYSNNINNKLTQFYDPLLCNHKQNYATTTNEEEKLTLAQVQSNKAIRKRYSMNEQSLSINSSSNNKAGASKSSSIKYRFSLKAISNKITTSVENLRNKFNTNSQSTKSFNKLSLPNNENLTINDDNSYMLLRSTQNMSIHVRNAETDYEEDDLDDNIFYNKRQSGTRNEPDRDLQSPSLNISYDVNYLYSYRFF
jgi:hypothetical protein